MDMYLDILTREQKELLPLISQFKREFYLVGGTAIALQKLDLGKIIKIPDLISLGAMKAFALGRRSKWKDYVDLYFLLKNNYGLKEIVNKSIAIYGQEFSEKLFRAQLAYHEDIDYSEKVEFLPGFEVDENEIKAFLINVALEGFD